MLNILVTDDDLGDRKTLKRALKESGINHSVFEAQNVLSAIELLEQHNFDVVLLDFHMPPMDGLQGIELILQKSPRTAIIMVTGQGDELIASEAIKRGASDYIPKKHISAENVRSVVDHVLEVAALKAKVEEQTRALERFADVLAHDLKAPIRHAKAFGQLTNHAIETGDLEEVTELNERMVIALNKMDTFIQTLQEYNHSNRAELKMETIDLDAIVRDILSVLEVDVQKHDIAVSCAPLTEICANGALISQLMQNLISNAIKYRSSDKPSISISMEALPREWVIKVKDNGIGIAPEYLSSIFEPFRRAHFDGQLEGTGLGLATCQSIASRHGGRIWCQSKLGQGATFYVAIPRPAISTEKLN